MSTLFPDFMGMASLRRIAQGDVGALKASVAALDARIAGRTNLGDTATEIDTLRQRHDAREASIIDETERPRPDSEVLSRLKVAKLRLREEMERLRHRPD